MTTAAAFNLTGFYSINESGILQTQEAASNFQQAALVFLLTVVIVVVVVGNTLVILAVFTTRRLRTVTNVFVLSLAVADWLVGIFVMPPAVAYNLMGYWQLGPILCDLWVSLDILLCTASILSLCAISVDRYLAVTQPLSYSRKRRSKRLASFMILIVWTSSALITCPPMFGWYESGRHEGKTCRYNKNTGYVIFSAMGSFFIPMVVMLYVYLKISCVIAQRHDQLSQIPIKRTRRRKTRQLTQEESDVDRVSSETEEGNKYARYYQHLLFACNHHYSTNFLVVHNNKNDEDFPKRTSNNSTKSSKSIKVNLTRSFNYSHEPLTPKVSNYYKSPSPPRPNRSEPHLHLDASMLNFEPSSRVASFRRESKAAQTLSIVMGGFILCWLPFFVFYLLTPFIAQDEVNQIIMQYFTWLGWINSAINPFIYAFYSPDFRIAFWRLTVRHCSKKGSKKGSKNGEFITTHKRMDACDLAGF